MIPDTSTIFAYSFSPGLRTKAKFSRDLQLPQKYSNPKEFLTPSPNSRGGLGWGKKFTTPARIAIVLQARVPRNRVFFPEDALQPASKAKKLVSWVLMRPELLELVLNYERRSAGTPLNSLRSQTKR